MKEMKIAAKPNSQAIAGHGVLFASLAIGALFLRFNLKLALLPAAVLAGWSQIGGL